MVFYLRWCEKTWCTRLPRTGADVATLHCRGDTAPDAHRNRAADRAHQHRRRRAANLSRRPTWRPTASPRDGRWSRRAMTRRSKAPAPGLPAAARVRPWLPPSLRRQPASNPTLQRRHWVQQHHHPEEQQKAVHPIKSVHSTARCDESTPHTAAVDGPYRLYASARLRRQPARQLHLRCRTVLCASLASPTMHAFWDTVSPAPPPLSGHLALPQPCSPARLQASSTCWTTPHRLGRAGWPKIWCKLSGVSWLGCLVQ